MDLSSGSVSVELVQTSAPDSRNCTVKPVMLASRSGGHDQNMRAESDRALIPAKKICVVSRKVKKNKVICYPVIIYKFMKYH